MGTFLAFQEGGPEADPLSPDASLVLAFGPLAGSPITTTGKFAVVCKSPLTGRINDSLAGSAFGIAGKRTGCDAIVLVGRAAEPTVLVIDGTNVRFEPAGEIRGQPCGPAERRLRRRMGDDYQIAVIGPAGESCVPYAAIAFDGRFAGRGGSGAVLGAKNIKAIAVRGDCDSSCAQPERLLALAERISLESTGPMTAKYRELGTVENLLVFNRLELLPTRNFQERSFDGLDAIAPDSPSLAVDNDRPGCAFCTIGCERLYSARSDRETEPGVRMEYENFFALGPLCGIDDARVILKAARRCNELGLDAISTGGTIAFAMECAERGLLDTGGLVFGEGAKLLSAIDAIPAREGIGRHLALGSRRLAQQVGQGSIAFAPQVKGLEMPGYEPRGLQTMALGLAVAARGADHNRSGAYDADFSDRAGPERTPAEVAAMAVETEDKAALLDSMILCKFLRGVFTDLFAEAAEMLNLATGWDTTADELKRTAGRIVTAKKSFNVKAGWTPAEDTLPARFFEDDAAADRPDVLTARRLAAMVRAYNTHRGWREDGYVGPDQLQSLGLPSAPDADN